MSKIFQSLQSTLQDTHIKLGDSANENCFLSVFLSAQHVYKKTLFFHQYLGKEMLLCKLSTLCHFDLQCDLWSWCVETHNFFQYIFTLSSSACGSVLIQILVHDFTTKKMPGLQITS